MSKIMEPWTPIEVEQKEKEMKIKLWGRSYTCSPASFLASVISQGQELLAAPIRLVGTENGKEMKWGDMLHFKMHTSDEEKVTICSTAESERFIVNTAMDIEYDGCIDLNISLMPQGRSPKQTMGLELEGLDALSFSLSRLWLEIPFKPQAAVFYQFYPLNIININGEEIDTRIEANHILQSEFIPQSMKLPFEEQMFIGNDDVGLGIFMDSDEGMQPENGHLLELVRGETETVLRVRLLDSEPEKWKVKGTQNGIDLYPISYRIGMIATPVRAYPTNPYQEKNIHIDCFDKIPRTLGYEDYLLGTYEDTDEIVLDYFKRQGVNTLYLHEKWNDMQNSPFLTETTAERLKKIVAEAHKRDMKVMPYFGYEISTLSPFWTKLGRDVMSRESEAEYEWTWYRYPHQRALRVCYQSGWQNIFADGVAKLLDEFHFDGVYVDSMVRPMPCINEKHGCGYRDAEGKLHATYPVWAIRSLMKKLYRVVTERGGIINNHTCASFNLAAMPYCHSMYEGEAVQQALMQGTVKEIPKGHFRSVFAGRNLGVPVYMLCYDNPPIWTQNKGLSMGMLYGLLCKPNHVREHLAYMSDAWRLTDAFDFEKAQWIPHYQNTELKAVDENVKISYYENDKERLLFCVNTVDQPVETRILLDEDWQVEDIAASCEICAEEVGIKFAAPGFDYAICRLKKQ